MNVGYVPISGNPARPSYFGGSVEQTRGFHPSLSGIAWLGQTASESDWYSRAKAAVAKFEQLVARTNVIASDSGMQQILSWVGQSGASGTPRDRYDTVVENLNYVESSSPPKYASYDLSRFQNRVSQLEDFNKEFETKVKNAELVYGTTGMPQPVSMTPQGAVASGPNWTLPILVGAGAVAITVAVTLLWKKK